MSIVERAKEFAIKAHGNQKYGKMPYEYHLQQVVSKLLYWKDMGQWEITDEMLAIGWLHDVIEDTESTDSDLVREFGFGVAVPVVLLTKDKHEPYNLYISAIKANKEARIVKIADTLCNLEASILSGEEKRINKYAKQLALLTG